MNQMNLTPGAAQLLVRALRAYAEQQRLVAQTARAYTDPFIDQGRTSKHAMAEHIQAEALACIIEHQMEEQA